MGSTIYFLVPVSCVSQWKHQLQHFLVENQLAECLEMSVALVTLIQKRNIMFDLDQAKRIISF